MRKIIVGMLVAATVSACRSAGVSVAGMGGPSAGGAYDVVITNGRIVDGTGAAWFWGDIALRGDRIARIAPRGVLRDAAARRRVDAGGMIVAPGFIDIQAQSYNNFMEGDGLALSMVTQGITTAIMGEGTTPAPISARDLAAIADPAAKARQAPFSGDRGFGNWLDGMLARGVSQNVGSFLGAGTVRIYGKGRALGTPTAAEIDSMRAMVRRAMEDGAFGVASALIYPPNNYASTAELTEVARAMAPYGGVYITHMRSEGDQFLEALDEAIRIGRDGGVPVEVYHLKASGPRNWAKMPRAIAKIDSARAAGQDVQADMYLYIAGGNSFTSCIAPKYAADGKLLENLQNAALRPQIKRDLMAMDAGYENLCEIAGPSNVMVVGFRRPELKQYEGKRLDEIARALGKDWADAVIDLNITENGGLGELLFLMSEENVKLQLKQPWMKFGTDAGSMDPARATGMTHPRAYGNFPRLLAKYVRDEKVIPLEDAVRKASSAVATRLSMHDRGVLKEGMKADIIVFDENTVRDLATFEQPHQLSVGMRHVFVNGVPVITDGSHTGAKPGQLVRGPGWSGWTGRRN
ncbi:MAG: D-aminoacylase [Gemmatimonadota bacterium]|nr:D-aminoacylase [Gemmatimonadota bacterium]